jgi:ArsR family transcriptional regulator
MPKRRTRAAFPARDNSGLVRVLKALAHTRRFRMVEELAASGELSCGQLAEKFELSQPTVSHHLKILMDAGILTVRLQGQHHFLSVNEPVLEELAALLPARLRSAKSLKPKRKR